MPYRLLLRTLVMSFLVLPVASAQGRQPAQWAFFDVNTSGHYTYNYSEQSTPGGVCPMERGGQARGEVLDVKASYRAKIRFNPYQRRGHGRWESSSTSRNWKRLGRAKLHKTSLENYEIFYCEVPGWRENGPNEAPVDTTCARRIPAELRLEVDGEKGLMVDFSANNNFYTGKCFFRDPLELGGNYDPYPHGFESIKTPLPKISERQLLRSRKRISVSYSGSWTGGKPPSTDMQGNVLTTKEGATAGFKVSIKRVGHWHRWR